MQSFRRRARRGVKGTERGRSFSRLSRKVVVEVHKLGQDRKQRTEAGLCKLSGYAQEVVKRIPKVIGHAKKKVRTVYAKGADKAARAIERLKDRLESGTKLVKRMIHQSYERLRSIHVPNEVYSLHEPHVACIRKGKRGTPNECRTKVFISIDRPTRELVADRGFHAGS